MLMLHKDWEFVQAQQVQLQRALPLPDLLPPPGTLEADTDEAISSSSSGKISDCPYLRSLSFQRYKIICNDRKFDRKTFDDDFPMSRVIDKLRHKLGDGNIHIDLIDLSYVKGSSYPLNLIVSRSTLGDISFIGQLDITHALSRDVSRPGFTDLIGSIFQLRCLKSLNLSYNRLRPEVLASILQVGLVPGECQLEHLDISGNCSNRACGKALGSFLISPECRLRTLKMNDCGIDAGRINNIPLLGLKEGMTANIEDSSIVEEVCNTSLDALELGNNLREDEYLDVYGFIFSKLTNLRTLRLAQLVMKGEDVAIRVMNNLFTCRNLCALYL